MSNQENAFSLPTKTVGSGQFNSIFSRKVFHHMFAYPGEKNKNQPNSMLIISHLPTVQLVYFGLVFKIFSC